MHPKQHGEAGCTQSWGEHVEIEAVVARQQRFTGEADTVIELQSGRPVLIGVADTVPGPGRLGRREAACFSGRAGVRDAEEAVTMFARRTPKAALFNSHDYIVHCSTPFTGRPNDALSPNLVCTIP